MGLLKVDNSSKVVDFLEKPQQPVHLAPFETVHTKDHYLGSMGIYVFKTEALVSLLKEPGEDFGKDLIPIQVKRGKTYSFIYKGYWEDIGTIASYYEANLALMSQKEHLNIYDEASPIYTCPYNLPSPMIKNTLIENSLISPGAVIEAKEIDNSIIGIRGRIQSGTVIRNSIVLGNHTIYPDPIQFSIGKNCLIEKAIIDEETVVGNNVQLINKEGRKTYDGEGIYIRDGIIIVPTGSHIPDGFVF